MAKAVIVGAGVAGLTAGIRLRQAGVDCLILEKHTRPGGELTAWRRGAYLIDNCMHWLNGTLPGTRQNDLWRAVGMLDDRTALCRSETFFQCRLRDETLAFGRDTALLRRRMHELSPVDKKEIDALIDAVEAMASVFAPRDRRLLKRAASAVGTAGVMASLYVRYGTKSLFDLASRFRHPLLRMGLTGFLGGAFSAFAWLYAYGAFVAGDADVPAGGSGEAAERMARRYAELGGELRCGVTVASIITAGGSAVGVSTAEGEVIDADAVVCAVDPAVTFGRLLPRDKAPAAYRKMLADPKKTPVYSALQTAFAARESEVGFFGTLVADAAHGFPMPGGMPAGCPGGRLTSPSPHRILVKCYPHETGFAPPGMCVLQTMQFVPEAAARAWIDRKADPAAYRAEKARYLSDVREALTHRLGLSELRPLDVWTPATYARYTGAHLGSFLGFAMTPGAPRRPVPTAVKGLDNVFSASQWRSTPGGLPVAANAGEAAAGMAVRALRARLRRLSDAICLPLLPPLIPRSRTPV